MIEQKTRWWYREKKREEMEDKNQWWRTFNTDTQDVFEKDLHTLSVERSNSTTERFYTECVNKVVTHSGLKGFQLLRVRKEDWNIENIYHLSFTMVSESLSSSIGVQWKVSFTVWNIHVLKYTYRCRWQNDNHFPCNYYLKKSWILIGISLSTGRHIEWEAYLR